MIVTLVALLLVGLAASPAAAYVVTNLNDAGAGSLRDAVSASFRTVTFAVSGTITPSSPIFITGSNIVVDARAAHITLQGHGLACWGTLNCRNLIIRGLRIRNAAGDGITVTEGASNIRIENVSVAGSGDGNIDITNGARTVTVAWSILGANDKNVLIKYGGVRDVRLHHNLFASHSRNPQARTDDVGGISSTLTLDMWNNTIVGWAAHGTLVWEGARANVINNLWITSGNDDDDGLIIQNALVYTAGNVMVNGFAHPNVEGTHPFRHSTGFASPSSLSAEGACTASFAVGDHAGALPRDAVDTAILDAALAAVGPAPFATPPEACQ